MKGRWTYGWSEADRLDAPDAPFIPPDAFGVLVAPGVVELLELMLDAARRGEIRGIGIVTSFRGKCDGTAYELGDTGIAPLVLARERLKLRLLEHEDP